MLPLYSGVLGLLMPAKKFIPLEYFPLDLEITLNPYALYSSHTAAEGGKRTYTVTKCELIANILYFNDEMHRSINSSIAHYGLFLHCNTY